MHVNVQVAQFYVVENALIQKQIVIIVVQVVDALMNMLEQMILRVRIVP